MPPFLRLSGIGVNVPIGGENRKIPLFLRPSEIGVNVLIKIGVNVPIGGENRKIPPFLGALRNRSKCPNRKSF